MITRNTIKARDNWQKIVESQGFTYHSNHQKSDVLVNWRDDTYYSFSLADIEKIEKATNELHAMCLKAVDFVIKDTKMMEEKFLIPLFMIPLVVSSWEEKHPSIMGRFDLTIDEHANVKMIEYNADTPTLLIESAIVQWYWMEDNFDKTVDQFNSLHERLIEQYKEVNKTMYNSNRNLTISTRSYENSAEEYMHGEYFLDLATQAGISARHIDIESIGIDKNGLFLDDLDNQIVYWQKLYPWEWLVLEEYAQYLTGDYGYIEPAWKMILSNKALLPVLYHLFPDSEYLLPSFFEYDKALGNKYVTKPVLSREGNNISIYENGKIVKSTDGPYESNVIYQKFHERPSYDGKELVIGSWIVGNEACGMILREADNDIVVCGSEVLPHIIV